jgi:hypothetical protein
MEKKLDKFIGETWVWQPPEPEVISPNDLPRHFNRAKPRIDHEVLEGGVKAFREAA